MNGRWSPQARYRMKGFAFGALVWLVFSIPGCFLPDGGVNWQRLLEEVGISILVGLTLAAIATKPE